MKGFSTWVVAIFRWHYLFSVNGAMRSKVKSFDERYAYIDAQDLIWDHAKLFWKPKGTVGDRWDTYLLNDNQIIPQTHWKEITNTRDRMAQWLEHLAQDRKILGSNPGHTECWRNLDLQSMSFVAAGCFSGMNF